MSNNNGNKTKPTTENDSNSVTKPTDDDLVNLTLSDMEETARCQALTDLELISEILQNEQLSLDSRVHELMTRLSPNWTNEITSAGPNPLPSYIAFAVPYHVAYNVATFDDCRCDEGPTHQDQNTLYRPCITCAVRASLFRTTKDKSFAPEIKDE